MVKSMTAYARKEEKIPYAAISIELRSVNHRFLEMSLKIPEELRSLEISLRNAIKQRLKRGKVDCIIYCHPAANDNRLYNRPYPVSAFV